MVSDSRAGLKFGRVFRACTSHENAADVECRKRAGSLCAPANVHVRKRAKCTQKKYLTSASPSESFFDTQTNLTILVGCDNKKWKEGEIQSFSSIGHKKNFWTIDLTSSLQRLCHSCSKRLASTSNHLSRSYSPEFITYVQPYRFESSSKYDKHGSFCYYY